MNFTHSLLHPSHTFPYSVTENWPIARDKMESTYLRIRKQLGQPIPFPPPLPSPKHTGNLSPKQQVYLLWWRFLWGIYPATIGRIYQGKQPIFLIGCHNSGTTILANLIGQHPDIVNWSEAPEVWTPDDAFLNWSVMPEPPLPLPFLFDLPAYVRTPEQHGHFIPQIQQAFRLFAATHLKGRFLNKNPHISISIPYIEAAFPDARYVYIRRNGYAVVQSLVSNWRPVLKELQDPQKTSAWAKLRERLDAAYFDDPLHLVRQCARYWQQLDDWAWRDLQGLSDQKRVYYTTYEAICDHPEPILREIFHQHHLPEAKFDWGQLHHPTGYPWTEMLPMENRNFKYRERLTVAEIQAISAEVGDSLKQWGYFDEAT